MTASCAIPQLDETSFDTAVLASPLPVFLYFAEQGCERCEAGRCLSKVLETLHGGVKCFCIQRAKDSGLGARYRVGSPPTILVFRAGRVVRRLVGHPLPGEFELILRTEFRCG